MIFFYEVILVEFFEFVEEWCFYLVESVVEVLEELMDKYLEGEELIEVEIKVVLC